MAPYLSRLLIVVVLMNSATSKAASLSVHLGLATMLTLAQIRPVVAPDNTDANADADAPRNASAFVLPERQRLPELDPYQGVIAPPPGPWVARMHRQVSALRSLCTLMEEDIHFAHERGRDTTRYLPLLHTLRDLLHRCRDFFPWLSMEAAILPSPVFLSLVPQRLLLQLEPGYYRVRLGDQDQLHQIGVLPDDTRVHIWYPAPWSPAAIVHAAASYPELRRLAAGIARLEVFVLQLGDVLDAAHARLPINGTGLSASSAPMRTWHTGGCSQASRKRKRDDGCDGHDE